MSRSRWKRTTPDAFEQLQVFIPKETLKILRQIHQRDRIPMSRLVCIAVDNELDTVKPFNYPVNLPAGEYHEYMYAKESQALLEFLLKFPQGASVDLILLCRREYGVQSREVVMEALRELIIRDKVEEFAPNYTDHNQLYNKFRVKNYNKFYPKFRRIEGASTKYMRKIKDEDVG